MAQGIGFSLTLLGKHSQKLDMNCKNMRIVLKFYFRRGPTLPILDAALKPPLY